MFSLRLAWSLNYWIYKLEQSSSSHLETGLSDKLARKMEEMGY